MIKETNNYENLFVSFSSAAVVRGQELSRGVVVWIGRDPSLLAKNAREIKNE